MSNIGFLGVLGGMVAVAGGLYASRMADEAMGRQLVFPLAVSAAVLYAFLWFVTPPADSLHSVDSVAVDEEEVVRVRQAQQALHQDKTQQEAERKKKEAQEKAAQEEEKLLMQKQKAEEEVIRMEIEKQRRKEREAIEKEKGRERREIAAEGRRDPDEEEERRQLILEQDEEYQRGLEKDRERERLRKAREEREALREEVLGQLPDEPAGEDTCHVAVRLLDGSTVQRRWALAATTADLTNWAWAVGAKNIANDRVLLVTTYPRKTLPRDDTTLSGAGLKGKFMLVLEDIVDEF